MAAPRKFTRIPKVPDLIAAGVPAEAIPTYCALADHADNKSGLCFPKMASLAAILKRSVRTVQRHLHLLRDKGVIAFVERRRTRSGRFSSYLYKVLPTFTTGQRRPVAYITKRTKPPTELKYATKEAKKEAQKARRREGYEWLFD